MEARNYSLPEGFSRYPHDDAHTVALWLFFSDSVGPGCPLP